MSLSGIDRRVATLYFFWNVFNVFLGGMLGGSLSRLYVFFRTGEVQKALTQIGVSLPSASNFFINFVVLQGFGMVPLRMLYPSLGVLMDIFRLMGIGSTPLDWSGECCTACTSVARAIALHPAEACRTRVSTSGFRPIEPNARFTFPFLLPLCFKQKVVGVMVAAVMNPTPFVLLCFHVVCKQILCVL